MLPSHPVVPNGGPATPAGPRGRTRALVVTGLALLILAVVGGTAEFTLVLAVAALGAAGVLALRTRRLAAPSDLDAPALAGPAAELDPLAAHELTERLRRLYDDHVEKVNMALAEDREDLVQEFSDDYMDRALRLMTAGDHPSLPIG